MRLHYLHRRSTMEMQRLCRQWTGRRHKTCIRGPVLRNRRASSLGQERITRDLLPFNRSGIKPNSHSIFNTLILDDDPMDGSRSLRKKRKTPVDGVDEPIQRPASRKRRRTDAGEDEAGDEDELASRSSLLRLCLLLRWMVQRTKRRRLHRSHVLADPSGTRNAEKAQELYHCL